ncbi:GNAT family N-acetyltransferase [Halorussus halophilus]|uniref:GNAT family N-acetyltransferase n=1 Tax=Halorussus halophilus TaxID=2650975 RepID=UPI001300EB19|nr:GNAT family N-acetyltransferase [Halorussus halophilus]
MASEAIEIREATHDDYDDVVAFTEDTWSDHGRDDYLPHIYHDWIEGDDQLTIVADAGDELAGVVQCVLLSEWEAWGQGLRVNPVFRGEGIATQMTEHLFEWSRERGARVFRNMVFSWNAAGLGQSRASGYDPITEFRWAHPTPDADASPDLTTTSDPDAAWSFWTDSAARDHLRGLALDDDESWALSELTRETLHEAADDDRLFVVRDGANGTRGFAHRVREYELPDEDGEMERWAEYGVGAWADAEAAASLLDTIARDAADCDADNTRVLIPETVEVVSDVAYCRTEIADEPDFVMGADLTKD